MTIKQLVKLYVKYVTKYGYANADLVLAKYLPADKLVDGTVHDVPVEKWSKLAEDLSK